MPSHFDSSVFWTHTSDWLPCTHIIVINLSTPGPVGSKDIASHLKTFLPTLISNLDRFFKCISFKNIDTIELILSKEL